MIQDGSGGSSPNSLFIVSYAHREEKGPDVNVAAHLLLDICDGAIVISNDSDLSYPWGRARLRVPVGTVNPSPGDDLDTKADVISLFEDAGFSSIDLGVLITGGAMQPLGGALAGVNLIRLVAAS